ncbi:hypothetical protein BDN72DRAFT_596952 [Pluteus cervinus]|uniref:Uncharacterized protein n=1 Tax=Pluteus cervinus TaxID=181527 RepID=A0ACD3A2K3_9AGAR|nr:hypothetical protein BDN72DRAFT_596952 [Pluteus cervinus]
MSQPPRKKMRSTTSKSVYSAKHANGGIQTKKVSAPEIQRARLETELAQTVQTASRRLTESGRELHTDAAIHTGSADWFDVGDEPDHMHDPTTQTPNDEDFEDLVSRIGDPVRFVMTQGRVGRHDVRSHHDRLQIMHEAWTSQMPIIVKSYLARMLSQATASTCRPPPPNTEMEAPPTIEISSPPPTIEMTSPPPTIKIPPTVEAQPTMIKKKDHEFDVITIGIRECYDRFVV